MPTVDLNVYLIGIEYNIGNIFPSYTVDVISNSCYLKLLILINFLFSESILS